MQYVWHESLEAHILHARDQLCRAEILVCRVAATLAEVVDKIFRHLAKRTAFLAKVHDNSNTASLRRTDALLDCEYEVRFARAYVRAKHIRTIAWGKEG
jgi:hypothetical protein